MIRLTTILHLIKCESCRDQDREVVLIDSIHSKEVTSVAISKTADLLATGTNTCTLDDMYHGILEPQTKMTR